MVALPPPGLLCHVGTLPSADLFSLVFFVDTFLLGHMPALLLQDPASTELKITRHERPDGQAQCEGPHPSQRGDLGVW